jgi:hypothetical protein
MQTLPLVNINIWPIVKIFVLFGLGLYLIFALVVIRQVQLMTKTIKMNFEVPVKFLALTHLLFAIAVFLFALIIL